MELQIAFVLDVTGSMQSWITAAKNQIQRTIEDVSNGARIEAALICYRDIGDEDEMSVIKFTENLDEITTKLKKTYAQGGNDVCENLTGALHEMVKLDWKPQSRKLCFIITDAPTHGSKYHTADISDDYPHELELKFADQVSRMCRLKIPVTFVSIDLSTITMTSFLQREYALNNLSFNLEDIPRENDDDNCSILTDHSRTLSHVFSRNITQSLIDADTE